MRVAVYHNNKDIRIEERPIPKISKGELLVKVIASGICGSDVMEWYRIKKAPLVLGHEVAGEIAEIGDGVKGYKKGDRVIVSHHVPCNICYYCLNGNHSVCDTLRNTNFDPGGFSEYIRMPEINVDRGIFLLPDELSFEEGTFTEPLACAIRGLNRSHFKEGQSVLIIGSGISGLLFIKLTCALGAGRVIATDINNYRLNCAKKFGADSVINAKDNVPARLRETNDGRFADLVIVCAGATSAMTQALQSAERGGTILFFAPVEQGINMPIPLWDIWRDGITMTTSYAGAPSDIIRAIELLKVHRLEVKDMITHRLSLLETGLGFQLVAKAQESIKVIIKPQR
ncbi:MAG: alcohol dehydrogenase [Nitrospinae bacterium RIFCSPLOWO2_02_39_17]|nr:MAG: alcohol dehydrogenase [Nitrospinae bacterium RIFCSPLOWO2_02_39_17]OGW09266.1 MAG: alcohol dehydrogenase [Nitrospinae bacterium RIFCSPLOWO2_12_39_15]